MRTPIAMGLLALALIPLAAEHSFHTETASAARATPPISEAKMKETIQSVVFTAQRNREIDASMSRVAVERDAYFAAVRNSEAEASTAKSNAYREQYFVAARNAEIAASLAADESRRSREFAEARNEEIAFAMTRHEAVRDELFADARNAEIEAAEARRLAAFAAERNAEIEVASRAATSRRQYFAELLSEATVLETGSLPYACPSSVQP